MNNVVLIGNLTRDVEVRQLQSGTSVAEMGLAVNNPPYKDKNGQSVKDTVFVDVEVWGKSAEVAGQHLKKGDSVIVVGSLKQENWEKDGVKRSKIKVRCDRWQFPQVNSRKKNDDAVSEPATVGASAGGNDGVEDIPF